MCDSTDSYLWTFMRLQVEQESNWSAKLWNNNKTVINMIPNMHEKTHHTISIEISCFRSSWPSSLKHQFIQVRTVPPGVPSRRSQFLSTGEMIKWQSQKNWAPVDIWQHYGKYIWKYSISLVTGFHQDPRVDIIKLMLTVCLQQQILRSSSFEAQLRVFRWNLPRKIWWISIGFVLKGNLSWWWEKSTGLLAKKNVDFFLTNCTEFKL